MLSNHRKPQNKKRKARSDRAVRPLATPLGSALKALPFSLLIGGLLLFLLTALLMTTGDPDRYHTVAGLICAYSTAFWAGAFATRFHGRRLPLPCALFAAGLLALLFFLVGLFLPESPRHTASPALRAGLFALIFPAALLGSLFGAREKRRKHRR